MSSRELRSDVTTSRHEQGDRFVVVERRQIELRLAGDPEGLAARHDQPELGGGSHELGDRTGNVGEEVLEVVQDDVRSFLADACTDCGGLVGGSAEQFADGGDDELRVGHRREWNEERASIRLVGEQASNLDREARLPRSAGADDRQDAGVTLEPRRNRVEQLTLAPEEPRRGRRQGYATRCAESREDVRAELRNGVQDLRSP